MHALIITNVQHDFLPGGQIGIAHADEIIPLINALMNKFSPIIATMAWHPKGHVHFASTHGKSPGDKISVNGFEQILWPEHCLQDTQGAKLAEELNKKKIEATFHCGIDLKIDSYSVFFDNAKKRSTGLADFLKKKGVKDVSFVGLATDYCILFSVLDALALGFQTTVIRDACKAINLQPGDEEKAVKKMQAQGANIIFSSELLV